MNTKHYPKITKQDLQKILQSRNCAQGIESLKDLPPPDMLKCVNEAAQLVAKKMNEGGKIIVVGDYDADGVCSSSLMLRFFETLGYKNFEIFIPNRFSDGYGISPSILERINAVQKNALVITVDNGVSAYEAANYCKQHNLELIITDHHTPSETLPDATFIINPKQQNCNYPFKEVCGCVVAWYFCAGIKAALKSDIDLKEFLPLLALATLGDLMPLVGVNRIFVQKGLEVLKNSKSPAYKVIAQKLIRINAQEVSFNIVPLLNCAGRMENAKLAVDFLCARNIQRAYETFNALESLNKERKRIQKETYEKVQIACVEKDNLVYAIGEGWHIGVLGVVCSQLAREYKKTAIVLGVEIRNDVKILKGSGRAFGSENLIGTAQKVQGIKPLMLEFGGHNGALGLSLPIGSEREFLELFSTHLESTNIKHDEVLGEISGDEIDMDLLKLIESFEPYGEGNVLPHFICNDLELVTSKVFGKQQNHLQCSLKNSKGKSINGVAFFCTQLSKSFTFCLSRDFRHNLCLQMRVV